MSTFKIILTVQFSLLYVLLNAIPVSGQAQQAYERGLEELSMGQTRQALDIWYNAYQNHDHVDSRIGFEFIRVATKNNMRSYFPSATNFYYRAITDGEGMNSRVAIRQEIERLKPIIGEGIYRQWMNWWDEEHSALYSDMKGFWIQIDPTPANATNERLIEHWQRIETAKQLFNKNKRTVYGTDPRALIYVRYGEADRVKNGILTLQSYNVRQWLEHQLAPEFEEIDRPQDELEAAQNEIMNRLQDAIYEFHRYPEYEIWFYDNIVDSQDTPIIFLFGTDVRSGNFTLQTSLEDFIPERAFYAYEDNEDETLDFTRAGITPALMLQLLYYEQLAQVDDFFNKRLNELQNRILEQGIQAFQGMDLAFQTESKEIIHEQVMQAPQQQSTYTGLIPQIPLHVYHYRQLGDSLQPEILTYVQSLPQEAFLIDYNRNHDTNFPQESGTISEEYDVLEEQTLYELTHNLREYNDAWESTLNRTDEPPLFISRSVNNRESTSFFRLPHTGKNFQAVSVELMNYDPDSESIFETPFPPTLRGWNKQQYRQPEPLISHPDSMEVSDLILGYDHPNQKTEPFDFKVANNRLIPFGEILLLHFEVYNLALQPDGFSHFEMTYRILPVDEEGNLLNNQTEFILTLNFTNEETTVHEDLEIETAEMKPGLYELIVSILDTGSDQSRQRKIRFEVVE